MGLIQLSKIILAFPLKAELMASSMILSERSSSDCALGAVTLTGAKWFGPGSETEKGFQHIAL